MNSDPSLPPALLLDLDDTILADSASAEGCWDVVCSGYAPALGLDDRLLLQAIDARRRWFWQGPARHRRGRMDLAAARVEIIVAALGELGVVAAAEAEAMAGAFGALREQRLAPFDGAVEALARLRAAGVRMALVTNGAGPAQRRKIERFGLARYFDGIVVEGEFGAGKPEAQVFRYALGMVAARPEEAWMVGDNLEWDVAGAQAVGMAGVWVDFMGQGLAVGGSVRPDRVIGNLGDLLRT